MMYVRIFIFSLIISSALGLTMTIVPLEAKGYPEVFVPSGNISTIIVGEGCIGYVPIIDILHLYKMGKMDMIGIIFN